MELLQLPSLPAGPAQSKKEKKRLTHTTLFPVFLQRDALQNYLKYLCEVRQRKIFAMAQTVIPC